MYNHELNIAYLHSSLSRSRGGGGGGVGGGKTTAGTGDRTDTKQKDEEKMTQKRNFFLNQTMRRCNIIP